MKPIRNPHSPAGDWFTDMACIDCGASRHVAGDLIIERDGSQTPISMLSGLARAVDSLRR